MTRTERLWRSGAIMALFVGASGVLLGPQIPIIAIVAVVFAVFVGEAFESDSRC